MKILTNLDLNKNEIQNFKIQNLATAPSNPLLGQLYYNTTDNVLYIWNNVKWVALGSMTAQEILDIVNGSTGTINDANLSPEVNDAVAKRHTHANMTILDLIQEAFTTALKTKLDGIQTGAEVNQNAFTYVKVGASTIGADTITDTFEIAGGTYVVLTPDATNSKITIGLSSSVETTTGSQQKANTAEGNAKSYADTKITQLLNSAPSTLDTLNELAKALDNDPNFATTMTTQLGLRTKKYTIAIGNGVLTEFTITHSLGTKDLVIYMEEVATGEAVYTDIVKLDDNRIKLIFATAPTTGQFKVTVVG